MLKKFKTLIITTVFLAGNYNLAHPAFANSSEKKEKIPANLKIEIDEAQYQDTIEGVSDKYNLLLKSFSALFKKNIPEEAKPAIPLKKVVSRSGRKNPLTHRSLAAGINKDGKIQFGRMIWPTTKVDVISGYGPRGRSFHHGIDIYNSYGAAVYAVINGTVVYSGWMSGYGNLIEVKHQNGLSTRYAHLSNILVKVGQTVSSGEVIGKVGNTGRVTCTHLHFEVRMNGVCPPLGYLL